MNDEQLIRYSRHILLEELGIEGQTSLLAAKALIIGAGGLGSPAAMYLASAGVGRITLVDDDTVDLTNLQRQILHTVERIGLPKATSGKIALAEINPEVIVDTVIARAEGEKLDQLIAAADIVLDCCDNFATRHAVNKSCVAHKKPLVSGSAVRFSGQLSVFDARIAHAPCYHCLFPEGEDVEEMRCAVTGVFAPLTGIIGAMQAAEAIKVITGSGTPCVGKLWLLDALTMQWRAVSYQQDPTCPICNAIAP